jgi:hypothetical protein
LKVEEMTASTAVYFLLTTLREQLSGVKCNGWHRSFGAIESGSIPTHPTEEMVVEGWSPRVSQREKPASDKRIALSSILRATTVKRL